MVPLRARMASREKPNGLAGAMRWYFDADSHCGA
jgi:hypothetical protein